MEETIIRKPTERDSQYIDVDISKGAIARSPSELFQKELNKQEKSANKKGLPFARHAARDDREQYQNKLSDLGFGANISFYKFRYEKRTGFG